MEQITLKQIKQSYHQKKEWEKQFPINYFVVRPMSFYLTYLVLKVTRNPAKVAVFGFILGMLGCFLLVCSAIWSVWIGIVLISLYSVSDAIDGNIARTTQNVTLYGVYLDGLLGDLIDGNYFFFLGIGLYFLGYNRDASNITVLAQEHVNNIPIILGAIIVICRLWANTFESRYYIYKNKKEGLAPFDRSKLLLNTGKSRMSGRWYFRIYLNIGCLNNQLVLLIILAVFRLEIWFLVFFSCFFISKALFYSVYYFGRTKSLLQDDNNRTISI